MKNSDFTHIAYTLIFISCMATWFLTVMFYKKIPSAEQIRLSDEILATHKQQYDAAN
jgi:hypothetical protein